MKLVNKKNGQVFNVVVEDVYNSLLKSGEYDKFPTNKTNSESKNDNKEENKTNKEK